MSTIDLDRLFGEGLPIGDSLVAKASLRVTARPMRFPVSQALVDNLVDLYERRLARLYDDLEAMLGDSLEKSDVMLVLSRGQLLLKAQGGPAKQPQTAKTKQPPKTVNPTTGERVKTPQGYAHVVAPGSRGGKFWRDEKGNVRYGDKPSGGYSAPAQPEHVVEHFKRYQAPTVFVAHEYKDLYQALQESDYVSETDKEFMSWWDSSYDVFLEGFKMSRKDVEKAGGLDNVVLNIDGRNVSVGEAIEAFFLVNAGDVDEAGKEEVLEAVRNTMESYNKALHEDPRVRALAMQIAEKREQEKNAFYLTAEQAADDYDKLAGDVSVTDMMPADLAAKFTVAMNELGLIEKATAGKAAKKRMRGGIVPKTSLLWNADNRNLGDLWKDNQLERLNASQLMAVYIAERAQDSFTDDGTYDVIPRKPGSFANKYSQHAFDTMADKLGVKDSTARDLLHDKLEQAAVATLEQFNSHNTGQEPDFSKLLDMKTKDVAGRSDKLDELQKKRADRVKFIEDVLAAQEDESFDVPASMQGGVWNGKTLKDKDHPEKGVWEPMRYQKKYINWMSKVKRGVLAASMGLGKTPMVISFMEKLRGEGKDHAAILFLPPSLMEQWPKEISRFAPEMADKVLNLSGLSLEERKVVLQSDMAKKARYILVSSGTLNGDSKDVNADEDENDNTGGTDNEMVEILKGIKGAVFIDEAHQGGYKKAGNTRHEIAKKVLEDREYAFGMTATPMPNDPMDLYHLTNLFAPGSVGDKDLWEGRLAGVSFNEAEERYEVSHPEHIADLNKRLKPYVYYKNLQDEDVAEDIGKGLPDKVGFDANKELWPSEGDLSVSKAAQGNGLSQFDYFKKDGYIDKMVALRIEAAIREREESGQEPYKPGMLGLMAGGMRVQLQRQASIHPGLIDPTYKRPDGSMAHSPKLKAVANDIIAHFSDGGAGGAEAKPFVLFSSFPGKAFPLIKKILAERGVDPSRIMTIAGDVSPAERGYVQDTINAGHGKVLLVGTASGGAGLNLQHAANKVEFLDEPASPAEKRQAQARVHRLGQKSTVYEKTLRTEGTFDSVMEQKLAGKQVMITALLGSEVPTAETFGTSSDEAIQQLLGRVKSAKFTQEQLMSIMSNADSYDFHGDEHFAGRKIAEDAWKEAVSQKGGVAASFTEESFKPDVKSQEKLKKRGAGVLATPHDETEWRAKWSSEREKRQSKQNYEMSELMAKVYKEKGEEDKSQEYERKMKALAEKFPELDSGKAQREGQKLIESKQKIMVGPQKPEKKEAKAEPKKEEAKLGKKKEPEKAAKPEPKKVEKTPKHQNAFGLGFHAKKHPFDAGSGKKIKGSKISQAEAAHFFDQLRDSKHKSLEDFAKKTIKPIWDDEGGKNPYSPEKANAYVKQLLDVYKQHELIHHGDE